MRRQNLDQACWGVVATESQSEGSSTDLSSDPREPTSLLGSLRSPCKVFDPTLANRFKVGITLSWLWVERGM